MEFDLSSAEHVLMFSLAVPKMVFSLGLLLAWIVMPIGVMARCG